MRALIAIAAAALLACGPSMPAPAAPAGGTEDVATDAPEPASAVELVQLLEAIATGARPGTLEAYVDAEFASRLPSGDDLAGLFSGYPEGCRPQLREGPGYEMIAIPPPMVDDDDEEAARIEAIIRELQASTEVIGTCTVVDHAAADDDVEEAARELVLWAIAVRRSEDGRFRALAWRDLRNERDALH